MYLNTCTWQVVLNCAVMLESVVEIATPLLSPYGNTKIQKGYRITRSWYCHKENMVAWLSWPCFHAPLYNFTPPANSVGSRHTSLDMAAASNAFLRNFADTIFDEILSKFGIQRVTSKGSRTMRSEWPDKREKTKFVSVARGGGNIFHIVILSRLSVGSEVVWVTGLFSLWIT